jgi:hypothetical protein
MNQTIYSDNEKNAIRFSNFKRLESDCPFAGLGVKYVASGEEIYYANDKKYKVKVGEYIIGNEFTKSLVQINSKEKSTIEQKLGAEYDAIVFIEKTNATKP